MSWFGGNSVNTQELDLKIEEATLESIPNGEYDVAVAFEVTDIIRSKKIPSKSCMRSLKKRLTTVYENPNLLTSTLRLIDVCVKNGGFHFLLEISSKEFMDYLVDFIFKRHYNVNDANVISNQAKLNVGNLILTLIKHWSIFFKNQIQLSYVGRIYDDLSRSGYHFPDSDSSDYLNGVFIDSETPADWVDSDECMICYNKFTMINRKHHCRSCGKAVCQEHSSHTAPLPALGIMEPVRVCDDCHFKLKYKLAENPNLSLKTDKTKKVKHSNDEDEDLKRAIELSLRESGQQAESPTSFQPPPNPPPAAKEEDDDEDIKAAIAASLQEFKTQEQSYQTPQQPATQEPEESEFYNNILPFNNKPQFQQPPQVQAQAQRSHLSPAQHIEAHKPQLEELTPKEEESINLYITLVNQLRSDRSRQANILYDKDLNELHTQVIQIKPKLNKSLRNSIEKYESLVALNNKISTITKLYDQFLEQKLSQAYGNHNIYSSYPSEPYQQSYQYSRQSVASPGSQTTGPQSGAQRTGPQPTGPQSTGPQFTGPQFTSPQYTGTQFTGPQQTMSQFTGSQQTGPPQTGPQQTGPQQTGPQFTGQGSQFTGSEPQFPTAPEFEPQQGNAHQGVQPEGEYGQYDYNAKPSEPIYEESEPNYDEPYYPGVQQPGHTGYNNIAAYPPIETLEAEGPGYPSQPSYEPQGHSTGGSVESTRSRYPPIDEMESQYEPTKTTGIPSDVPRNPPVEKRVEEPLIDL